MGSVGSAPSHPSLSRKPRARRSEGSRGDPPLGNRPIRGVAKSAGALAALLLPLACSHRVPDPEGALPTALAKSEGDVTGPLKPLPSTTSLDPAKVALGRELFNDARLSHDNTVPCSRCHDIAKGGVDGMAKSVGIGGAVGDINAPTVLNSGLNFKQFWNGRADTLEDQITGPVTNPKEMGSTFDEVVAKLHADAALRARFEAAYHEGVSEKTIKDALATFERSLITPSPFDRFLRGDANALTEDQKRGYEIFRSYGCVSCHQGVNIGGNMFQRLGAMKDYFAARGAITEADYGRFNVTGRESDRFRFKVPSLRNVEKTAPYFHDGSAATLPEAVAVMAEFQLGRPLPDEDKRLVVEFLKSLTGEVDGGKK